MAFGNAILKSNIVENWLFQFGYYNGDAQGNGDGGFDAVMQADGTPNKLTAAVNTGTATFPVDDGTVFAVGDHLLVENEVVKVTVISSNDLTVLRTQMNTSVDGHVDNEPIKWYNFFPLSLADITEDDVYYYGNITSSPRIRESISLSKGTAKTSNLSISLSNFKYQGSPVIKELYGGTRKYINQTVKIYSKIDADSANLIGVFRLTDITTDGDSIKLSMASHRPWDFITIPSIKSDKKNYAPVSYGNYIPNAATTYSSPVYHPDTNYNYRPVPFDKNIGDNDYYLSHPGTDNRSSAGLAYYDSSLDSFIPLASPLATTTAETNVSHTYIARGLLRGFKQTGNSVEAINNSDYGSNVNWVDSAEFIDKSTASGSKAVFNTNGYTDTENGISHIQPTGTEGTGDKLRVYFTNPDGTLQQASSTITYNLIFTAPSNFSGSDQLVLYVKADYSTGETNSTTYTYTTSGASGSGGNYRGTSGTHSGTGAGGTTTHSGETHVEAFTSSDNFPAHVDFYIFINSSIQTTATGSTPPTFSLEAVEVTMKSQWKNDKEEEGHPELYIGADGEANGITGGETHPHPSQAHEMHLDLLNEYTGLDIGTGQTPQGDINGWADLNKARIIWVDSGETAAETLDGSDDTLTVSDGDQFTAGDIININNGTENMLVAVVDGDDLTIVRGANYTTATTHTNGHSVYKGTRWDIRFWQQEPIELKKVLERAQYEGGFIFRFKQGDPDQPQYIHIPNSSTTGYVLSKNDISNIGMKTSPVSGLITKRTINSIKHPNGEKYFNTLNVEDTTNKPRQKWHIKSKENIEEVNLDMLVTNIGVANPGGQNTNDSFAAYQNNIFGDLKLLVSCTIVNPVFYSIEVGSVIEFDEDNMYPETPMGHNSATWDGFKMIVTSTQRSPGTLKITAREI